MFRNLVRLLIMLLGLVTLTAVPAPAETSRDTLVMAKDIGDIITLDPAESFELSAGEILANVYDRIMTFEPEDPGTLTGGVAESHAVSDDSRTITLRIRDGLTFHSGNPVRPEDVEFSLERAVERNGTPAFILTQFGWHADNVGDLVEVVDERHVRITIVEGFSPRLVLHALSAGIGSVVDRELVMAHEQDDDLGAGWLATNSAGSGPYRLQSWLPKESVVLESNSAYRQGAPGVQRVILRHEPEPSAQLLLLERGEVDIARDLTPDLIAALAGNDEIAVDSHPRGTLIYLAANAGHPILGNNQVVQALRYAVDYHGMVDSFLAGQFIVHQAFWPRGLWAAYTDTPHRLDINQARALLAQAGYGGGFAVRIETLTSPPFPAIAHALGATLAEAGIDAQVVTWEGAELWPRYRGRKHELILAPWSGVLAWRNVWAHDGINAAVVRARNELDPERRAQLYRDLQRRLQGEGPYVIMFQKTEQMARRRTVAGLATGPAFDQIWYRTVSLR